MTAWRPTPSHCCGEAPSLCRQRRGSPRAAMEGRGRRPGPSLSGRASRSASPCLGGSCAVHGGPGEAPNSQVPGRVRQLHAHRARRTVLVTCVAPCRGLRCFCFAVNEHGWLPCRGLAPRAGGRGSRALFQGDPWPTHIRTVPHASDSQRPRRTARTSGKGKKETLKQEVSQAQFLKFKA